MEEIQAEFDRLMGQTYSAIVDAEQYTDLRRMFFAGVIFATAEITDAANAADITDAAEDAYQAASRLNGAASKFGSMIGKVAGY